MDNTSRLGHALLGGCFGCGDTSRAPGRARPSDGQETEMLRCADRKDLGHIFFRQSIDHDINDDDSNARSAASGEYTK
jgi:hypothetical protein